MRYYATASGPRVRDAIRHGLLGMITTPAAGNIVPAGVDWCADNSCFTPGRYPGDTAYLRWLTARADRAARCAFATAPDIPFDAAATLNRAVPMLERIRAAGYPAALVAQDGLENLAVPWSSFDALFIGATTSWKLGSAAAALAAEARARGLTVHMGRVNSLRRLRYANTIGCHSVDGTYLAFGPDRNLPRLLTWLADLNNPSSTDANAEPPAEHLRAGLGTGQASTQVGEPVGCPPDTAASTAESSSRHR